MKRRFVVFNGSLLILLSVCAMVWAQATAQISGVVRDQSGAVLPGVEVTATQTETGAARTVVTNETGSYVLTNLALGPYRVEASLPGFRTFAQTGIVLQVNSSPVINPVLDVGQVTETIEVQANAAMVETRTTSVGQVIESQRILELPLNGRQVTDLIVLSGAAVQTGVASSRSMQGIPTISMAGGLISASGGATYVLDGAMHNNPYDNLSMPFPFPDATQEFKVETGTLQAQTGMHAAGAITAVTKSGTNEIHGDAFWFVRNDLFNARNYFATKNSTLKRNQFGGTAGGAIVKNKLFFFGGYQGTTVRQDPSDTFGFIPTVQIMAGDFTAFASPACNGGRQITLAAPFVNNRVDPALISPAAKNVAAKLPVSTDPCGRYVYGNRLTSNDGQVVGRVDYQQSSNHSLFGRYIISTFTSPPPYTFAPDNLLTTAVSGTDNMAQTFAFGDTYLIGSNVVNAFRFAANRTAIHRIIPDTFRGSDLGIKTYSPVKHFRMTVTGGPTVGFSQGDATYRTTTFSMNDNLSVIRGTHQMAFGADIAEWRVNINAGFELYGAYSFNGQFTGLGMADFVLGKLNTYNQRNANSSYTSEWYFGSYAQDTWKVTPKVTLNYGVRWEPFFPRTWRNGRITTFDYARFQQGVRSTVYPKSPAGFLYPGDPGFRDKVGAERIWGRLAPRVGLAWDPAGDGRLSVRAGFSYAYDLQNSEIGIQTSANPWGGARSIPNPVGGFDDPWQGVAGGNPFPYTFQSDSSFAAFGAFLSRVPKQTPSVTAWNLSIQRQVGSDWLVSASYLGNNAAHIFSGQQLNTAVFFPGVANANGMCFGQGFGNTYTLTTTPGATCSTTANTNQRRRFFLERPADGQYIGDVSEINEGLTQNYNGLLLSIQRRAAQGVTVGANYTWSHCIGVFKSDDGTGGDLSRFDNIAVDRGNCAGTYSGATNPPSSDQRHIFNLTAVAETPRFESLMLRRLATGWRLSGLYRYSSGSYQTVTSGLDRALTNGPQQRPDRVLADPYGDRSGLNYLNPAAFAQPALGTYGNSGVSIVRGPADWQFDAALSRTFSLLENQRLEVRAEAFNVTNSLRRGLPSTALNGNTFGQILTARDPRILQFALKYLF